MKLVSESSFLKKLETQFLETSLKDGYVIVFSRQIGSINIKTKQSCSCSDHNLKTIIKNYNTKTLSQNFSFKSFLYVFIKFYQQSFSYFFGGHCRFYPSCSAYALDCLEKDNTLIAVKKIIIRLFKCHPLSKYKGYDPA